MRDVAHRREARRPPEPLSQDRGAAAARRDHLFTRPRVIHAGFYPPQQVANPLGNNQAIVPCPLERVGQFQQYTIDQGTSLRLQSILSLFVEFELVQALFDLLSEEQKGLLSQCFEVCLHKAVVH